MADRAPRRSDIRPHLAPLSQAADFRLDFLATAKRLLTRPPSMRSRQATYVGLVHRDLSPLTIRFLRWNGRGQYAADFGLPSSRTIDFVCSATRRTTMPQSVSTPLRRTIRRHQLREMVPLADSTIYEMEQRGEFPRRFALSPRCVVWDLAEVEAWLSFRRASPVTRALHPDVRQRRARPVKEPGRARRSASEAE